MNFDALLLTAHCVSRQRPPASTGTSSSRPTPPTAAAATGSTCNGWCSERCPAARAALLQGTAPILLVSAGLLARYDLMTLITEVEEHAGRPGHTPNVWLLLPTTHQGLPVIDGVAVPIVNNIQNTRTLALAQAWVENKHRASVAP